MANGQVKYFMDIPGCRVTACCDILPGRAKEFADRHGIPAAYEDAEQMFRKEKLDGVSIVTVDRAHAPMALVAAKYGVNVMCEKPLATSWAEAKRMVAAVRRHKLITAVNFTYRNNPATQRAAALVAAGKLGRVTHVEGSYLQSWLVGKAWGDWRTSPSWLWRLSTRHGSSGTLGDIGVHLYDLASFVIGDFAELSCTLKTYDKGVKRMGEYVLDANDSMLTTVRFKNGAMGVLHATRRAPGQANTVALRVYGDKGSLDLNLDRPAPDTLRVCLGADVDTNTWRQVKCPPVPTMYARFVTALKTGRQGQTSFEGGARVQSYLDASVVSAKKKRFVRIG